MIQSNPLEADYPVELAFHLLGNLRGPELTRLCQVNRHVNRLVQALLDNPNYWRSLGFEPGKEPRKTLYDPVVSFARRLKRMPTILDLPANSTPYTWRLFNQLECVSLKISSNPGGVAVEAARFGDGHLCKKAIETLRKGSFTGTDEATAMWHSMRFAILRGDLSFVEMLIGIGAPITQNTLNEAILKGQTAIVEVLAAHNPELCSKVPRILWSAYRGETEELEELVRASDPSPTLGEGFNELPGPLHLAAMQGHTKTIQVLAELGCPLHLTDMYQASALHHAASRGQAEAVRTLLDLGCSMDLLDDQGHTPLFKAAMSGHTEVIEVLAERGANVNAVDYSGATPLHLAANSDHVEVVRLLVRLGCPIDTIDDEYGQTALHWAAMSGSEATVVELLRLGCPIDATDKEWKTAADVAFTEGHTGVVKILLDFPRSNSDGSGKKRGRPDENFFVPNKKKPS